MDNNEMKNSDFNYIFEIVERIYSIPTSNIEKEFSVVKRNIFGNPVIFLNSDIITTIRLYNQKETIYRIEVNINMKEIKLRNLKLYLKKDYNVGFNIHDEETFFNFKLDKSHTINAIHFGLLPPICNFSDEIINRIWFNFE